MNISLVYQNNADGRVYDITELASKLSWRTDIFAQPGKLTFNAIKDKSIVFNEGSVVTLTVDGVSTFEGFVFSIGTDDGDFLNIMCYDQLRYLKAKDTYVFKSATLAEQLATICADHKLKFKAVHTPTYKMPGMINDNMSLFDMVQKGIDKTLIATGEWYTIRNNAGVIELVNILKLKTNVVFSDDSNITGYNHNSSIDKDTYNYVKLVKDNKKSGKREVYIVKDSSTASKWGRLQYFDKMDEGANAAQIEARADALLKTKNRKTKTLQFNTKSIPGIQAGSGVLVEINDSQVLELNTARFYFVTECTHNYDNEDSTMNLTVEVSA